MMMSRVDAIRTYLMQLQDHLCVSLSAEDGKALFLSDAWERPYQGGDGISCVLEGGGVFERAGVNFSHVRGKALPAAATAKRPDVAGCPFEALGVSLVLHPYNPYAPTTHFNLRFFIATPAKRESIWWFGGGFDLTPYYGFVEDCLHWHRIAKQACDPFGEALYPRFKQAADDYFYLPHRQETRGIGGLFFDDFCELGFALSFDFAKSVGDHFLKAYLPIVSRRKATPFGERERDFQCYRRGRYVEFNLLYDRGTLFGMQLGGRTESILMSLPPYVNWRYDWHPAPGSKEAELYQYFLGKREWLASRVF